MKEKDCRAIVNILKNIKALNLITYLSFVVLFVSILYFIYYFNNDTYRHGAMGNLFATLLGVILGIPIILWINKYQQDIIDKQNEIKNENEINIRLFQKLYNVSMELNNNSGYLKKLVEVFNISPEGRTDIWELSVKIVNALSIRSYIELFDDPNFVKIFEKVNQIQTLYLSLEKIIHDVRIAEGLHALYFSYGGGKNKADEIFKNVKKNMDLILALLPQAQLENSDLLLELQLKLKNK